ncbi:MAG: type II CRISPR RNA-guided endonuclease Cas9, partial [Oscillospiraceae bacterium]
MNYKIGLDIGIASVGWATLLLNEKDEPMKILDMGSRVFDAAEVSKTGASLAAVRRIARGSRRRLRRHAHRIERIKQLFEKENIINEEEIYKLYEGVKFEKSVYEIRYDALNRKLNRDEFIRLLIHLAQRRGFKSNRKVDAQKDKETGKLTTAVSENNKLLAEKGYKTIGEMLYLDEKFAENKRNTSESYSNTFDRGMLVDEIKIIFDSQRKFGNENATEGFQTGYLEIYESQRSFEEGPGGDSKYGGNQIEKMFVKCIFEKEENRGLKAQYTIEYTSMLEKINSIKIFTLNEKRPLTKEERITVKELFLKKVKVTYADIRKAINLSEESVFNISYGEKIVEDIEGKTNLNYMKAYHTIKKAFADSFKYLTPEKLDIIGYVLTVYKTDEKIAEELKNNGFDDTEIKIISTLPPFAKTAHLSVKACKRILPFLEEGMTYDKACDGAGYAFKDDDFSEKSKLLPANSTLAPELNDIRNPVVRRAISQTIKVINNIIRKYDESPTFLSVELARELSNDFEERKEIEKSQNENYKKNQAVIEMIEKEVPAIKKVNGQDILKLKLWQDQDGRCPYSQKPIL